MEALELFAGAGGLALGTTLAGFEHQAVLEWNKNACDTIRENNQRGVISWPLHQGDVRRYDFSCHENLDLLAGGPPCQPFSIGGKHRGQQDHRNLFPEVVRAVRETKPRAIVIENVKGLLRQAFAKYFEYILLQITYPELTPRPADTWNEHLSRLERHHTKGRQNGLFYQVVFRRLNAADYGVPQKRERVFIVAFRGDIHAKWTFPEPSHSQSQLLRTQWVTGEYWERHRVSKQNRPMMPSGIRRRVDALRANMLEMNDQPWLTVRDAIGNLPDPRKINIASRVMNHKYVPGAKAYGGHTGSPLDEPSKTLKAGDHGVPGGENMVAYPDGEVRYYTARESARIQSFPDNFIFQGSWTETMRQLGNAVPVRVAEVIASSVASTLKKGAGIYTPRQRAMRLFHHVSHLFGITF